MKLNYPKFSPFDIRIAIRIVAGLLIWKTLSLDFTNLIELTREPRPVFWQSMQFSFVTRYLDRAAVRIFVSEFNIQAVQIGLCISLALAVLWMNRWAMMAALALFWAFWCYLLHFLAPLFETELCLYFLLLVVWWPGRWRSLVYGDRTVTPEATGFGCVFVFTIGLWYFLAGLCKVAADPAWVLHVRLEYLYPAARLWRGDDPSWLPTSVWLNALWTEYSWFGVASATLVLVAELAWPLAVVSRWARRLVLVAQIAGLHTGFFLAGGSLFLSMTLLLLAVMVPWRKIGRRSSMKSEETILHGAGKVGLKVVAVMILTVMIHVICAVKNHNYCPYMNWYVFGWTYPRFETPIDVQRIGYRDSVDGEIKPLAHNCGGFLEYRYVVYSFQLAKQYVAESDARRRDVIAAKIRNLLAAMRPFRSNEWLLGPFALPPHTVIVNPPPNLSPDAQFFIMQGKATFIDRQFAIHWDRIDPLQE